MATSYICDCCKRNVGGEYKLNTLVKELCGKKVKDLCDKCFKQLERYSIDLRIKMGEEIREKQRLFIKELVIKNGVYL